MPRPVAAAFDGDVLINALRLRVALDGHSLEQRAEELVQVGILAHHLPIRVGEEGVVLDPLHLLLRVALEALGHVREHRELFMAEFDETQHGK